MITVVMNDASDLGALTRGTRLFDENGTEIKGVTLVELRAEVDSMWRIRLEATVKVVRVSDPDAPKLADPLDWGDNRKLHALYSLLDVHDYDAAVDTIREMQIDTGQS